jgi:2-oxoisovalerate dehydrogenase E2 component (dihydrolipoyl transacylase)
VTTFNLPDLGEGLQEAEIVAWHVKEGDDVRVDQLMVSVETAKAVVEVPSPYKGKVTRLLAAAGETVATNQAIVEFDLGTSEPKNVSRQSATGKPISAASGEAPSSMTVVGRMNVSDADWNESAQVVAPARRSHSTRLRAAPAVRILAKRLKIDLATVHATGKHGLLTLDDVLNHAGLTRQGSRMANYKMPVLGERLAGEFDVITGARKAMAQSMTLSRDEIAMVTVFDNADIHSWSGRKVDMTARIIRALCKGVAAEPAVNSVFDPNGPARRVFPHVDLGIAMDVGDKLFVPVIRDAHTKSLPQIREELNRLKQAARDRTLAPEEFRDYTITLTNFGTLAGRYATPMVVPPTIAILGSGKVHRDVVATEDGGIEVHSRIPLSLSFDHRAITGGEACRFLAAVINDLELAD